VQLLLRSAADASWLAAASGLPWLRVGRYSDVAGIQLKLKVLQLAHACLIM